ncbi:MAG: GNAT family N-acetyltransferase [Anaerolineales bacterium]
MMCVLETLPEDHAWVENVLVDRWGSTTIISRGRTHEADQIPGYILWEKGQRMGLITYRIDGESCEIVTLDCHVEGKGIGKAMIDTMRNRAKVSGCDRLWIITTNDNLPAQCFYQKRGFLLTKLYPGAVGASRLLKPSIPLVGYADIPIRDEIRLEMHL